MLRSDIVAQLDALNAFMASTAFALVQANFEADVKSHEASILAFAPRRIEDVADLNMLYGKREVAIGLVTHFEELRNLLISRIAQMDESGNIVAPTET